MLKTFLLAMVMATSLPAWAGSLTYVEAKALADRDEASVSAGQSQELLRTQGEAITYVMSVCAVRGRPQDVPPFVVVGKLDSAGKMIATWRHGDAPFASCFEEAVSTQKLFTPPHAPFYTSFEMNFRQ